MVENTYGRISIREFLVDLLGSLVPGILFIFSAISCVACPTWVLLKQISKAAPLSEDALTFCSSFSSTFRFELILFLLITSYVLGHFFFRQDPKEPDKHSYNRISKKFTPEERKSWPVRKERNGDVDIQFPYRYLYEYLQARRLTHLAKILPWKGKDKSTHNKRTKAFINLIKIRLLFHFPDKCGQITRNEAHVRLMSSVWYASRTLFKVSIFALIIGFIALLVGKINSQKFYLIHFIPLIYSTFILLLSLWAKIIIEKFIHYQRIREIIYVLETAHTASKDKKDFLKNLN